MNNCTISIPTKHFAAAIHAASKRDIRYYLNGVYVEATEKETRCTATNGYLAATFRHRMDIGNGMGGEKLVTLIVPRDTVELVNKATRGKGMIQLERTEGRWTAVTALARFPFEPVDGKFPDYRRVFPSGAPSGEPAQFDPELLGVFAKVAKALGNPWIPEVAHNGVHDGARVTLNGQHDFVGVVMPWRCPKGKRADVDPSWATAALAD